MMQKAAGSPIIGDPAVKMQGITISYSDTRNMQADIGGGNGKHQAVSAVEHPSVAGN